MRWQSAMEHSWHSWRSPEFQWILPLSPANLESIPTALHGAALMNTRDE
jgi:hypothetical protein